MKAEQGKSYSTAAVSKQKWSGPVFCSQHSYTGTCQFEERVAGGGGGGSLLTCVASGIRCDGECSSFCWLINTGSDLV